MPPTWRIVVKKLHVHRAIRDGPRYATIPHTAGSIAWMKDEGGRMKDETSRIAASLATR